MKCLAMGFLAMYLTGPKGDKGKNLRILGANIDAMFIEDISPNKKKPKQLKSI